MQPFPHLSDASEVQFEGDLGEILALRSEMLLYIGLREKWESQKKKKFSSFQHTIDKLVP